MPVDTTQTIETPEGVEFEVHLAGPLVRLLAASIDLCIKLAIYSVLAIPLAALGKVGHGLLFLAIFPVEWGYPIYFEMFHHGATPGKQMFGLQVRNADGTPVSWKGSILRNLLRTADFLPVGYALGIITLSATGRFQRIGDLAGDTIVCYRKHQEALTDGKLPDVQPVALAEPLTIEEQRAIIAYAERTERWNYTRSAELSRILQPLTGERSTHASMEVLQGVARWITRGR